MKLKNLLFIIFLVFFITLALPSKSEAISFTPQVPIPGLSNADVQPNDSTRAIGNYIRGIYNYGIGIVAILATVVMMIGGFQWIIAGGSAEKIGEAKAWITAAISGLVLALSSYMILSLVSPNLVNFKVSTITPITKIEATSSVEAFLASDDCISFNKIGLVNKNDPNAINMCSDLCVSSGKNMDFSKSDYYKEGLAYCCFCN